MGKLKHKYRLRLLAKRVARAKAAMENAKPFLQKHYAMRERSDRRLGYWLIKPRSQKKHGI